MNHYLKWAGISGCFAATTVFLIKGGEYRARHKGFAELDPDPNLRRQEKDVLIPSKMRQLAQKVECFEATQKYQECCKQFSKTHSKWDFTIYKHCREENAAMLNCMNEKFVDPDYYFKVKEIYLDDKYIRHSTGVVNYKRDEVKEYIARSEVPTYYMTDDTRKYYENANRFFMETGDVDAFDKHLFSIRST